MPTRALGTRRVEPSPASRALAALDAPVADDADTDPAGDCSGRRLCGAADGHDLTGEQPPRLGWRLNYRPAVSRACTHHAGQKGSRRPGVPFDVGRPIIRAMSISTALRLAPDKVAIIEMPTAGEDEQPVFVLIQARLAEPDSESSAALSGQSSSEAQPEHRIE